MHFVLPMFLSLLFAVWSCTVQSYVNQTNCNASVEKLICVFGCNALGFRVFLWTPLFLLKESVSYTNIEQCLEEHVYSNNLLFSKEKRKWYICLTVLFAINTFSLSAYSLLVQYSSTMIFWDVNRNNLFKKSVSFKHFCLSFFVANKMSECFRFRPSSAKFIASKLKIP